MTLATFKRRWEEFCRTPGLRPNDIPARPDRVYAKLGWEGWWDWLGTPSGSGKIWCVLCYVQLIGANHVGFDPLE